MPISSIRTQIVVVCITAVNLIFSSPEIAEAQKVSEKPIYVVDVQKVLDESKAGKKAKEVVQAEAKKRQVEVDRRQQELKSEKSKLMSQAALLSEEALMERGGALQTAEQGMTQYIQEQKQALSQMNVQEIGKIVVEIEKISTTLGKEIGAPIVIEKDPSFMVYVREDFDLTERVIKILDK